MGMGLCKTRSFLWLILYAFLQVIRTENTENIANEIKSPPCDFLTVENGAVYRTRDGDLRDTVMVDCYPGFTLQGARIVQCEEGEDNPELPTCVRTEWCTVGCTVEHGTCSPDSRTISPGEKVTVSCDPGFVPSLSQSSVTCLENGNFDNPLPSCIPRSADADCLLTEYDVVANNLLETLVGSVFNGHSVEVDCKHGYFTKLDKITCHDGVFDMRTDDICHFVGVEVSISCNDEGAHNKSGKHGTLVFDKGEVVVLTCLAHSDTPDGLPVPEITWHLPSKLRDYVTFKQNDAFIHAEYIDSVETEYGVVYSESAGRPLYQASGTLRISPTMDVHNGIYTCVVKVVNFSDKSHEKFIEVRNGYGIAMWFLLIIPVLLFIIVHCFYRKANTMNPFPTPNKITKDMMQDDTRLNPWEVDKKKKLEELRLNPANQKSKGSQSQSSSTSKNARARRGAVVDI